MAQPLRLMELSEPMKLMSPSPAFRAYQILYVNLSVLPIIAGIDKFFSWLVNWEQYVAPVLVDYLPVSTSVWMRGVGILEILTGILVIWAPRIGSAVLAGWLGIILLNLLLGLHFYDVALRDFGLLMAAVALMELSKTFGFERRP